MPHTSRPPIYLIVNADDFGYFPSVSEGIRDAAARGAVTATGLLANSPDIVRQIRWLQPLPSLDCGVHLNLTSGAPLTPTMAGKLAGGQFPGLAGIVRLFLARQIALKEVRAEWRAQIELVRRCGIRPNFLNSHQHIHMLPPLFGLIGELAREFHIPHIRFTRPLWLAADWTRAGARCAAMQLTSWANGSPASSDSPRLVGLGASGKLNLAYLTSVFSRLKPGRVYELMCHPGHFTPGECTDRRLLAYHDWQGEWELLMSRDLQLLYHRHGIRLIGYRDLPGITGNRTPDRLAA